MKKNKKVFHQSYDNWWHHNKAIRDIKEILTQEFILNESSSFEVKVIVKVEEDEDE